MLTLEEAISIAALAHIGQVDKSGKPYILHPLRIMFKMQTTQQMITAVLHDILEDTEYTLIRLIQLGLDDLDVQISLWYLSKLPEEQNDYDAYITRLLRGPKLALLVKIADLEDNLDPTRLLNETTGVARRIEKYSNALKRITANLDRT